MHTHTHTPRSVLAPTGFCLQTAAAIEARRTGSDRGKVAGLNTHAGVVAEYARVSASLRESAQLDLAEGAGSVLAALAAMTAAGVRCDPAALAAKQQKPAKPAKKKE